MILWIILKFILSFILFCVLSYALIFIVGWLIPVNRNYTPAENGVELYIGSNGMHTEFILPATLPEFDWKSILNTEDYELDASDISYFGIGWGDEKIYLEMGDFKYVTAKIILHSLFVPSAGLLHIKGYDSPPFKERTLEKISISKDKYKLLCQFIHQSFTLDSEQNVKLIPNTLGFDPGNFYSSEGKYHCLQTCNTWVARGLKKAGVRTTLWTSVDKCLYYQLKKAK